MANDPKLTEFREFLARYIHSVEQLEILCILAESPARVWPETEIFRRIQSSMDSVSRNLRYFAEEGILNYEPEAGGYRFLPRTEELARLTVELLKTYRERPVSVIEMIYKMPTDPIQDFAAAFKLRKDKNDR